MTGGEPCSSAANADLLALADMLENEPWHNISPDVRPSIIAALRSRAQCVLMPPFDVGFIAGIILAGILDDWENGAYSGETRESAKRLSSELAERICVRSTITSPANEKSKIIISSKEGD